MSVALSFSKAANKEAEGQSICAEETKKASLGFLSCVPEQQSDGSGQINIAFSYVVRSVLTSVNIPVSGQNCPRKAFYSLSPPIWDLRWVPPAFPSRQDVLKICSYAQGQDSRAVLCTRSLMVTHLALTKPVAWPSEQHLALSVWLS